MDRTIESTWYFRQETFHWNERLGGADFVNEYGPLSTLGYQHRSGIERFRFEIFGGTEAYYGAAQSDDGTTYPYNQSNGTNYIGLRGEYELLIEPAVWPQIRFVLGIGTRFWLRDLQDLTGPDGTIYVSGYQETWWTIYPYIGVQTREPNDTGFHWIGSARVGLTAFTYQYADFIDLYNYPLNSDTVLYPRCGVTAQLKLGVQVPRVFARSLFRNHDLGRFGRGPRGAPARLDHAHHGRSAQLYVLGGHPLKPARQPATINCLTRLFRIVGMWQGVRAEGMPDAARQSRRAARSGIHDANLGG